MSAPQAADTGQIVVPAIVTTLFCVVAALTFSALWHPDIFTGWIAFLCMLAVPVQLVIGALWRFEAPAALARLDQPAKGVAFLFLTLLVMIPGGLLLYVVPGYGLGPTPMLIMATITSVVATFWVVLLWNGWPLERLFKRQVPMGLAALALSYAVALAAFAILFNFGAMAAAPFYNAAADPRGLLDAWTALPLLVTTVAAILAWGMLDFAPAARLIAPERAILFRIVASLIVAVLACRSRRCSSVCSASKGSIIWSGCRYRSSSAQSWSPT